jgi:hypothetical protein
MVDVWPLLRVGAVALIVCAGGSTWRVQATPQTGGAEARTPEARQQDLPPLSYTCPMHSDVISDSTGTCPICRMVLEPIRLDSIWRCPVHTSVTRRAPGKCPTDQTRDLVRIVVAVSWTCLGLPEIDQVSPGTCPDGRPMTIRYTDRSHGDHNPQHGGLFFMAPDKWHHLEGAYPAPGVFRLYVYDDFTKPLPPGRLKAARSRVVTEETLDPETKTTREITSYPMTLGPGGRYLEARIDPPPVPAKLAVKVTFSAGGPEYRFDFAFAELSEEARPPR